MSRLRKLISNSSTCFTNGFDFLRHVALLLNELESTVSVLLFSASGRILTFKDRVLINGVKETNSATYES